MFADIIAFFVYSYLGTTLESTSYFITGGTYYYRLLNPITSAFPLYGIGAYSLVYINFLLINMGLSNLSDIMQIIIKFFVFGLVASIIEYITGKYFANAGRTNTPDCIINDWNYSNEKWNIEGIVSLEHFVMWGLVGLVVVYIHPFLMKFINCGLSCGK